MSQKQEWGSRLGVILAVAGSAVGLGNFLRFPGQAAENGGGAFMIPYFAALLLLGIPIGWAEWTMGRYGGRKGFHSSPAILGVVGRGSLFRYLGIIGVLIPLCVSFYYVFIEAWCLSYAIEYAKALFTGAPALGIDIEAGTAAQAEAAKQHFADTVGRSGDGVLFEGGIAPVVWVFLLVFSINIVLVVRGLSGGIETFCKWAMPAMALCAIFVLVRVLTLDSHGEGRSVSDGLGYMWNPDFAALKSAETWIAAAGQIFFSLSVGFGVIINYASYMRKKDDLVLSGLTSSATNEVFEVGFGGLITLTAAVVFLGVAGTTEAVSGGSFGLGFSTLPIVFAHMPWGNLFGFLWFFMLFLAAITSSISMYQPTMAFLEESLGVSRKQAAGMVVALGAIGSGWCVWHSGGLVALDTIDSWVGTLLIVVLALVQVVAFGWVWGLDAGMKEAHHGSAMRIPAVIRFVLKYVAPIYLLVALGLFVKDDLPKWVANLGENTVARNSVLLVAGVIAFLVACTAIGARRWRGAGLDLDGERLPDEDLQSNQRS